MDRNQHALPSRNIKTVVIIIVTITALALSTIVMAIFLSIWKRAADSATKSNESSGSQKFEADFIIIGGGTAGCVVAARLAEYGFQTLLLSSGSNDTQNRIMREQTFFSELLRTPHFKRYLPSNLSPNLDNRTADIIVWNTLGGNSINGGGAQRMMENDWKRFIEATNDSSFDIKSMSEYYKMVENYTSTRPSSNTSLYGKNGPIRITHAYDPIFHEIWKNVAEELNETFSNALTEESDHGFSFEASTYTNGIRSWSCDAYLTTSPNKNSNLKVLTSTTALKFNINERTKQVENVLFISNDGLFTGIARKEYILSAGTFFSPHLLMLSGIGDRKILQDNDISVKHELTQVGKNLADNGMIIVKYQIQNFSIGRSIPVALLNTQRQTTNNNPNTFLIFKMNNQTQQLTVTILNALPKTTVGVISLHNSNPLAPPKITLDYLTHSEDLDIFLRAIAYLRKVMSTNTMKRYANLTEILPGLEEKDLSAYVRNTLSVAQHFSGTCAIGHSGETSVVDKYFKVHGIGNLRVVDASVFPMNFTTKTGPCLTIYALAEKAAHILQKTYS